MAKGATAAKAGAGAKAKVTPLRREDPREAEREDLLAEQKSKENELNKQREELEEKIKKLEAESARIEWDIGTALKTIKTKDLWRSTGCKNFDEYVEMKFDFSPVTARDFINIATMFKKDVAAKIPIGNLRLLSHMPNDEVREKMTKLVERDEPSFRQVQDMLKEEKKKLGLQTTRNGADYEGSVMVSCRLKVGPIFDGKWKLGRARSDTTKQKRMARFKIGDTSFVLEDLGSDEKGADLGFVVRVLDLNATAAVE